MDARNHDIETVNGLIKTTIDSVDGYRSAAEDADSNQFQSIFLNAQMSVNMWLRNFANMCAPLAAIRRTTGQLWLARTGLS